jgi:hypothetical protein
MFVTAWVLFLSAQSAVAFERRFGESLDQDYAYHALRRGEVVSLDRVVKGLKGRFLDAQVEDSGKYIIKLLDEHGRIKTVEVDGSVSSVGRNDTADLGTSGDAGGASSPISREGRGTESRGGGGEAEAFPDRENRKSGPAEAITLGERAAMRGLVVEDEPVVADSIRARLVRSGFVVDVARNGAWLPRHMSERVCDRAWRLAWSRC